MERTSGLKECPGCGLRNRQGATQCDFCGWDFKEASDDWMGKVSDLEKIGKEAVSTEMDKTTLSKIEMTITKPAEASLRERKVEESTGPAPELATTSPEPQVEMVAQAEIVAVQEPMVEVEPLVETPVEIEPAVPEVVAPIEATPVEPVAVETASAISEVKEETNVEVEAPHVEVSTKEKTAPAFDRAAVTTYAMMGTGLSLYVLDLFLTTSNVIDKVLGWGVIIFASALIALAAMRVRPKAKAKGEDEDEVLLCPICHEVVGETEANCPSCGAKFLEASVRE